MTKNLIPEILKLLGVEYGEKFKLHNKEYTFVDDLFMFDKDEGLVCVYPNGSLERFNNILYDILSGYCEIVKLPYTPQNGNKCWMINITRDNKIHVFDFIWSGDIFDIMAFKLGIVYKTKAEAKANLAKDYEKLTGRKLEVNNNG